MTEDHRSTADLFAAALAARVGALSTPLDHTDPAPTGDDLDNLADAIRAEAHTTKENHP